MKKKAVATVYETYDYDEFRIMEKGNRDVDHVARIEKSMKEKFLFSPILVNENMEIIDGQNSFMAARRLGKPIYFIEVKGYAVEEVRILNTNSKNWTKKDFVKSFADEGKEEYVKFMEFQKRYPDFPVSICEYILRLSMTHDSDIRRSSTFKSVERGLFTIQNMEESCRVADMILSYKPFCGGQSSPVYKRKEFVAVIMRLSRIPEFDNDLVLRKIRLNPRAFVPCVAASDYVAMIEDIVNFRNKNKVRFNV